MSAANGLENNKAHAVVRGGAPTGGALAVRCRSHESLPLSPPLSPTSASALHPNNPQ